MKQKRISLIVPIVILSDELLSITHKFLITAIAGLDMTQDEIIIIDNGSNAIDSTILDTSDIYYRVKKPIGYGGAMNEGIKIASGKYLVFANNDLEVGPDWAQKMIEKLESDPKVGIVSSNGSNMIETTEIAFAGYFWMCKREVIESIGFFSYLAPYQGDDSDFCFRAVAQGWNIAVVDFFINHPKRKSTHMQSEFANMITDSEQWQNPTFQVKHGFDEVDWYRKGLLLRKKEI